MDPRSLHPPVKSTKTTRLSDISLDDLKAVMREELERFKSETGMRSMSVSSEPDEEDGETQSMADRYFVSLV